MDRSLSSPDPAVLGRILLLQSAVHAAPDVGRLSEVVVSGLSGIPGVSECCMCVRGWDSCPPAVRRRKGAAPEPGAAADCPADCPAREERTGWKRHLLKTSRGEQGVLQLRIASEAAFAHYEPFVGNTANLVALHLENLDNAARLGDLNRNLERLVAERTASLIESEARFRVLSETVPQLVWSCRADGFCDYVNARWLEYTGAPALEQYGYGWWELVHPDDRAAAREAWQRSVEQVEPFDVELRIRAADGSYRWFKARAAALRNEQGRIVKWFGTHTDIDDLRGAEEALRQSQVRLHLALDAANAGAWEWDLRTNGNVWTRELWKVYGLEPQSCEPSYESWLSCVHPEDRADAAQAVTSAAQAGAPLNAEWRVMDSDGAVRWLMSRGQPVRGNSGEVVAYAGIAVDITDRKRTEESLHAAQERYRLISENTADVIWTLDPAAGRLTYVSPSVERLRGYTAEEVMAQPLEHALTLESLRRVEERLPGRLEAFARGEATARWQIDEVDQPRKDGSIVTTEIVTTLVTDEQRKVREIVGVSRDITERKAAERALREGREELARLNAELETRVNQRTAQLEAANEELEAFAYSISHDLRAPLRAIDGFSHALKEDFSSALPEEGQRYLGLIRRGAQQMSSLIEDLLAFSRLSRTPLSKRTVDTRALVSEVLEEMRPQHGGRQIDFHIEELPACLGDPHLLKQVWANLLSNAVKYTRPRAQAEIRVGCEKSEGEDVFFVQDNGCGFDMRYADRLFGVFQRLHRADEFEGAGVGLAIVQRIVRRHDGRVWADAAVDRGATLRFTLQKAGAGAPAS